MAMTILFTLAQMPLIMRHSLDAEKETTGGSKGE